MSALCDLAAQKQFVFGIPADGVELAALHQIIDVLPAAPEDLARFAGAHNPVPHKTDKVIQGERHTLAVRVKLPIRDLYRERAL